MSTLGNIKTLRFWHFYLRIILKLHTILTYLITFIPVSTVVAITSTKYLKHYCHQSIFVNTSLILELTNELLEQEPDDFIHCAAKLVTGPGLRLLLHFITLDISFHNLSPDRYSKTCYQYTSNFCQNVLYCNLYKNLTKPI